MAKKNVDERFNKALEEYRNPEDKVDNSRAESFSKSVQSFQDELSGGRMSGSQIAQRQSELDAQAKSLAQWASENQSNLRRSFEGIGGLLGAWNDTSRAIKKWSSTPLPNYGWNREAPEMIAAAQTGTIGETPDVMALRDAASRLALGGADSAFKPYEDFYKMKNTPLDVAVGRADDFKRLAEYQSRANGLDGNTRYSSLTREEFQDYTALMDKYHLDTDSLRDMPFDKMAQEYAQQATNAKLYHTASDMEEEARNDPDFEKLSREGLKWMDRVGTLGDFGDQLSVLGQKDVQLALMSDDQKAIYGYYLAKNAAWQPDGSGDKSLEERKALADQYYHSIAEDIAYRYGQGVSEANLERLGGGKAAELANVWEWGLAGAYTNMISGAGTLLGAKNNEAYYSPTATGVDVARSESLQQYAGDSVVRKAVGDLVMNTANQVPQILTSYLIGALGGGLTAAGKVTLGQRVASVAGSVATMGVSVYGQSYDEARRLGMDTTQAGVYGVINSASELALGELLGGVGKGTKSVMHAGLERLMPKVDSAVLGLAGRIGKTAVGKYMMDMGGEFLEEYLQDALEPWFRSIATGVYNKPEFFSADALYSGLLGALSAGLLNVSGMAEISDEFRLYKKAGAQIKRAGTVGQLKSIASTFSADAKAYQLAEKLTEDSKPTEIGKALKAVGAALSDQNVASMSAYLQEKYKLPKDSADKLIGFFRDYCNGEELSDEGLELLDVNDEITEAFLSEIVGKNVSGARKNAALQALAQNTNFEEDMTRPEREFNRRNAAFQHFLADTMLGKSSTGTQTAAAEESPAAKKTVEAPAAVQQKAAPKETRTVDASKTGVENVREWLNNSQIVDKRAVDTLVNSYESAGGNQDVLTFVRDAELAYTYGKYNMNESVETAGSPLALTEEQARQARSLGKMFGWKESVEKQNAVSKESGSAQSNRGTVRFEYDAQNTRLTAREQTSVDVLSALAQAYNLKLSFFESTMEDGKRVYKTQDGKTVSAPNGYYTSSDGTIHIDVHAGQAGQGVVMYTAAHELAHHIAAWDPVKFRELANFLVEQYGKAGQSVSSYVARQMEKAERQGRTLSYDEAFEEFVADSLETMLADGRVAEKLRALKEQDKTLWQKVKDFFKDFADKLKKLVEQYKDAAPDSEEGKFVASLNRDVIEKLEDLFTEGVVGASENFSRANVEGGKEVAPIEAGEPASPAQEVEFSIRLDGQLMEDSQKAAEKNGFPFDYEEVRTVRNTLVDMLNGVEWTDAKGRKHKAITGLNLPADKISTEYAGERSAPGNRKKIKKGDFVLFGNASYGRSVENTSVCIRSIINDAIVEQVELALGRKLSITESLYVTQQIANYTDIPQCVYCYVAADRAAYNQMLGQFLNDRPKVIQAQQESKTLAEAIRMISKTSKPTAAEINRATLWYNAARDGKVDLLTKESDYAGVMYSSESEAKYRAKLKNSLARQEYDLAVRYASNASHAKKRVSYTAYDGAIADPKIMTQKLVDILNSEYGLRMYSYSDFSPAFILENVQMITDAAARGLKMLAYTKELDFVKLFAPTGMNINISVFGMQNPDADGNFHQDAMWGADWAEAQKLRSQYGNVGCTFVATSDAQVEWAMQQDWIDVVIPYHSVFAGGTTVGRYFGYTDYKSVQADAKSAEHRREDAASVYPPEHQNDIVKYVEALGAHHLQPRFAKWITGWREYLSSERTEADKQALRDANPYYMKLVNETRRSAAETPVVKPVFGGDFLTVAGESLQTMARKGGYAPPFAQDIEEQTEFAKEIAGRIEKGEALDHDVMNPKPERTGIRVDDAYAALDFDPSNPDIRPSLRGYTKDGRSVYETDFDDSVSQEERIRLFKERIATVFNLGMVELKTDTKKIQVRGDKFTWNKSLFGNTFASQSERDAMVNSLYDMADILQHSTYDPKATGIEPSYSNPKLKPKNPAHSGVKYWYKFRNSIVADGVGYDVTFNIRDKGREQYEYLIEFKENATPKHSNTVYKDLLRTAPMSQGKNSTTPSKSQEKILRSDRDPNLPVTRAELAEKLMELTSNPIEKERLTDYIANAGKLDELQTKLQKLNSELKKLPAADKATDKATKEKIAALRLEAQKTANRLDTYERKLVNLEATAPIKALMQRQSDKAYQRGTQMAERLRGKYTYDRMLDIIKRVGKKLDASKNTERTKEGVRTLAETVVSQSLQFFDKDTGMDAQTMLMGIANMYAELKDSMDTYIEDAYKPEVHLALTELAADLAGATRQDLTTNELQEMYNVLRAVETSINKAGYLFGKESSTTVRQAAEAVVTEMQAQKQAKPRLAATKRISDSVSKVAWADMKPIYAIRTINSPQLTKMFNELLYDGQNTWIRDINRGAEFMQEAAKKYNFEKWDHKARHEYTDKEGQKISLSLEQMMYIYALIRRGEQAINHLYQGGFVFAEDVTTDASGKRIAKDPKAHQLTTETMEQIRNKLKTDYPEAARFVEDVQEYLSTVLAKDGNEVSYELYGLNAYGEKNYIPIHSAGDFHARASEVQFQKELGFAQGLANRSFTKRTVRKASNPILLSNFSDVASGHISDMAQYHAFAVPLTNLKKVMAWSERAPDVGGAPESVRSAIRARFGSDAPVKYLDNLINDLNASPRRDPTETVLDKGLSTFKRSAVVASASVAIQQPSAIARTLYVMNPLNFLGAKVEKTKLGKTWDQLCAYSSTAAIKDMGGFDVGMSGSTADYIFGGAQTKGEKIKAGIDAATGFAPEYMDKVTWCTIWNAVKRETKRSNPGLLSDSEEFLKKAGRRFDEIVNLTQVYDSTLTKSQAMRSRSTYMKMITAFMAEPTTSINMLVDGFRQGGKTAVKAVATWTASALLNSLLASIIYAGRDDDDEKTWVEKYAASFADEMKDAMNPLTAIPLVQDLWNICQGWDVERSDMSVFADIVNGVRRVAQRVSSGKEIGWKDYEETILAAVQALGLPLKNISRDLRAVVQTITSQPLSDTQWYEILSGALPSLFPADKSAKLYYAITNGNTEYAERLRGTYKDDVAYHTGIRTALADTDPRIVQAAKALDDGDLEEYKRLVNAIKSMGFIQDDVVSAVNNKYNEMHKDDSEREFTEGKISMYKAEHYVASVVGGLGMEDEIFNEIVRAYLVKNADKGYSKEDAEGNVRKSLLKELKEAYVDTGVLDRTKAKTALQKWMSADKAEETLKQWDYSKSVGAEWNDRYTSYYEAITDGTGDASKIKAEILKAGVEEKYIQQAVVDRVKDDYSSDRMTAAEAQKLLKQYGGLEAEEAQTKINVWDYMGRHPDSALQADDVALFYDKYKAIGVPEANFEKYLLDVRACKGEDKDGDGKADSGTKKAQILKVINELPVSDAVKDALYYDHNWAASKIYEAPWH